MSVDPISAAQSSSYPPIKNDFQSLSTALQNGNLTAAQNAYASIQSDQQNQQGPQPPPNSQIAKDFSALGDALSSGDLSGAQAAFSSLQTDIQSLRQSRGGGGGKGGGGGGKDDDAAATDNSQKTVANEVTQTNTDGTVTVTTTYTDGTTSTETEPNPNPVVSQSPLSSSNPGQLAALLTAQEQAALNPTP